MRTIIALLSGIILLMMLVTGCEEKTVLSSEDVVSKVSFTVNGLQPLQPEYHYHGWLLWLERKEGENFNFLDLGQYDLNNEGAISAELDIPFGYVHGSKLVLFTAEVDSDTVFSTPAIANFTEYTTMERLVVGGLINANTGEFSISYAVDPFTTYEKGNVSFILDSPSDNDAEYFNGLWFVSLDTTDDKVSTTSGLKLPMLMDKGWQYEAFVDIDGEMYSLGSFQSPLEPDDGAKFYDKNSNPDAIYAFPGEDFITKEDGSDFLPDLRGRKVYITLEENFPEAIGEPFKNDIFPGKMVMFELEIPQNAQPGMTYSMDKATDNWPSGTIDIEVNLYD